jgi:hypothetical protein
MGEKSYNSTHSVTSALETRDWPPTPPGRVTPWERVTGTLWIELWVGSRAHMVGFGEEKNLSLPRLKPRVVLLVDSRCAV